MRLTRQGTSIRVPEGFNYRLAVWSGWSELAPFSLDREGPSLSRVQGLKSGKIVRATTVQEKRGTIEIHVESQKELDRSDLREVERVVETCLRLDEDLSPFYGMLEGYPEFGWVGEMGAGRSIRCPTVFEDVVKTICTTNASWGLTKGITRRLCEKLGEPFGEHHTFPAPQRLASATEEFLRGEVKSGYRSRYLVELARRVVDGELDVEAWRGSPLDSAGLKGEILAVRGVGEYAANNIMHLLGRYDFLALDSWIRRRFSEIHGGGGPVPDDEIEDFYAPFGRWRGLVLNLDMTKENLISRGT